MGLPWGKPFLRALVFALGLGLAVALGQRLLPGGSRAAVGHPAPDASLPTLEGGLVTLSKERGHPLVLNFWAVWCPPCRDEMPLLDALARQRPDLAVLAVDVGDSAAEVRALMTAQGLSLPVALDEHGSVARRYGVQGLPTSFFLDAQGVIRAVHWGALDESALAQGLRAVGLKP